MTAIETVSGRTQLRYRGEPVTHEIRWYGSRSGSYVIAKCEPCGWQTLLEGGHTTAELDRLARQHGGDEDP